MTKPATPRFAAHDDMISPMIACSRWPPASTTITSPGAARSIALWTMRLSPGATLTVNAGPASVPPRCIGRRTALPAPCRRLMVSDRSDACSSASDATSAGDGRGGLGRMRNPAGMSGLALDLDLGRLGELAVDARHALDLALRREPLVEALRAEAAHHLGPRREPVLPARDAAGLGLGVVAREVGAHAHQRLDRHRLGDHVVVLAPVGVGEGGARGLQEVADHGVIAVGLPRAAAGGLDLPPAAAHPAVDLVEELRLQHPLVARAAAAEPVDAVAQRAVGLAVELLDDARGELAVRRRPRHALVQVDEVALVDAGRRGVDDHEHLGGESLAPPVEDRARHADRPRLVGVAP